MSGGMKFRLVAFILGIAVMFGVIAWTGHTSWRRSGELREKLTAVQWQSFQIADHLQQTIWQLDNLVLRYGAYHDTNAWTHFQTTSARSWINGSMIERPILTTDSRTAGSRSHQHQLRRIHGGRSWHRH